MSLLRNGALRRSGLWTAAAVLAAAGCGSSNSEVGAPATGGSNANGGGGASTGGSSAEGGSGGSGGSNGTGGSIGTGGSAGTGGSSGTGGSLGTGGTTGSGGAPDAGGAATGGAPGSGGSPVGGDAAPNGACPTLTSLTLAVHEVLQVSWPQTQGANMGTGVAHIWNRTRFAVSGNTVSGDETIGCGTALPGFSLNPLAVIIGSPSMVEVDVPDSVWDQPTMPKFHTQGTLTGFNVGSTVHTDPTVALVGLTMSNPLGPWPSSYLDPAITKVDADGDGKPGFTAVPRMGGGFGPPPTGIFQPGADRLYLVSRNVIALDGTITACDTISGTATVSFFDNHVVGCHPTSGGNPDCTVGTTGQADNSQAGFVDQNRTLYTVTSSTFTAKKVADTATCADVRAALPQ